MKKIILISLIFCAPTFAWQSLIPIKRASMPEVCFTPNEHCADKAINAIDRAKKQVLVQAYGFTNMSIAKSLMMAKSRGVDVEVLLDKSNLHDKHSVYFYLMAQHIPVKIDYKPAIAHNKVIVIDDNVVITGSYNYTNAAENKNAENLLIIHNKQLTAKYLANWKEREEQSR